MIAPPMIDMHRKPDVDSALAVAIPMVCYLALMAIAIAAGRARTHAVGTVSEAAIH